jgi:hypothetical protein
VTPGELAQLDQSKEHVATILAAFGCDRRDSKAMAGALAMMQTTAVISAGRRRRRDLPLHQGIRGRKNGLESGRDRMTAIVTKPVRSHR